MFKNNRLLQSVKILIKSYKNQLRSNKIILTYKQHITIIRSMLLINTEKPLGYKLKLINEVLINSIDTELRPSGLTFSQTNLLSYLEDECKGEPVNLKTIENYFHLTHPTVIGIVSRLEEKGLVTTKTDLCDKRCKLVTASINASKTWEIVRKHRNKMDSILQKNMSEKEKKQLNILLDKILKNLAGEGALGTI
jgi:MarR family transcriptional regulator, repressor for mepA